jgi:hypothetical protein
LDRLFTGRGRGGGNHGIGGSRGPEAPLEPNRTLFERGAVERAKTRTELVFVRKRQLDLINHVRQEPRAVRRLERHYPLEDIVARREEDPVLGCAGEDGDRLPGDGLRQKIAIEPQFYGTARGHAAAVRRIRATVFAGAVTRVNGEDVKRGTGSGVLLRCPEVAPLEREEREGGKRGKREPKPRET